METAMKITSCSRAQWANRWTFSQLYSVVMSILKSPLMFSWWNCLTNNTKFNWVIGMFIDTSIKWLCLHELLAGPNIPNMSISLSENPTQFISCQTHAALDKSDRSHDAYKNMQMTTVWWQWFSLLPAPGYEGCGHGGQQPTQVLQQGYSRQGKLDVLLWLADDLS